MAVIYALLRVRLNNVQSKLFVHKKYSNHRRNRHYFSANGPFLLLPLALKWGLFLLLVMVIVPCLGTEGVSAATLELSAPTKLEINVQPTAEGVFEKSNQGTISVTSDAYAGYELTISGSGDNNALVSGSNSLLFLDDGTAISEETFRTNKNYNNRWGYKPSMKDGNDNTNFLPGPKMAGDVIDKTENANTKTHNYTFDLGVRVDNNQAAGTYIGTFVIMAVANDLSYTITYDKNADDAKLTAPAEQTSSAPESTPITIATAPTRDKYVFLGWCDQETEDETCNGNVYQPDGTYELKNADNTLNLHAMWAGVMQNWDGCNALEKATIDGDNQISLIDTRNNRLYYVAKLPDNNCWMTENLDLDLDVDVPLTPEDSDVKIEWSPMESTRKGDGAPSTWGSATEPQSYDPGDVCWKGNDVRGKEDGTRDCDAHDSTHWHFGNFYNYSAAVAKNDTSGTGKDDSYDTSICPAGWHLPNDKGEMSFEALQEAAELDPNIPTMQSGYIGDKPYYTNDASTAHLAPYYFSYNGRWQNGGILNYSHDFVCRSNTAASTGGAYALGGNTGSNNLTVHFGLPRADGFSVRCVTK